MVPIVDVLIPTFNRPAALAITLTSLAAQTFRQFAITIADQSEGFDVAEAGEVEAVVHVLQAHGHPVTVRKNLPRRGMAQQRHFLLEQVTAPYALFLDDDIIMESYVIANMVDAIREEGCGFVGSALAGLTYRNDVRPHQQHIEFWDGPVTPELIQPGDPAWERYQLHNAANLYHVAQKLRLSPANPRKYKVAWVGGCVLYDVEKLRSVGGFSFWKELPEVHAGEDVLAQLRVMDAYGGCGLIPSGVYHLELPTTIPNRPVDAPRVLKIEGKKDEPESA